MVLLDGVSKSYGGETVLVPTTLEFAPGRVAVLIGPSGCGKSTLLRMIAGLTSPDSGRVLIGGEAMTAASARRLRHGIGYVIQEGGLFPHLTVEGNVALLPRHLGRSPAWIASRIAALGELLRLPGALLRRYPGEISGGQRQRVGIMRALMLDPPLLLLDEPLGALDPLTRYDLQDELKRIFGVLGKTVILVTHDLNEAAHFGEDIVLLRGGRVVQRGTIGELARAPAEPFVTGFLRAHRSAPPDARVRDAER